MKGKIGKLIITWALMLAMLCACTTPAEPTEPPTEIEPLVVQQEPIPQPEISLEETDELIIYTANGMFKSAVKEFQELHPEINVRFEFVSTEDVIAYLSGERKLKFTPDILSIEPPTFTTDSKEGYYQDVQKVIDDGCLLNLQPLMEQDETFDSENYIKGALESGQYRNGQYLLPFSVIQYYYLISDQKQLDEIGYRSENVIDSTTFLEELARVRPAAYEKGNYQGMISEFGGSRSAVDQIFQYTGLKLIDTDTGTILPEPEKLYRLCRAIKTFYYGDMGEQSCTWNFGSDDIYRQLSKGSSYFSNVRFFGAGLWSRMKGGGMEPVITEMRNMDGEKLAYAYMDVIGISAQSKNQRNAWSFCRYLLDNWEKNEQGLPIRKEAFERGLDQLLDQAEELGQAITQTSAEKFLPLTEEERESFKAAFRGAETGAIYSEKQSLMFEECMEPYFKGEADFDSCARALQESLKKYMLE